MKRNLGYTLVELMTVLGIIAILLAIVIASASQGKSLARDNQRISDIKLLQSKLEDYRDKYGVYPATLQGLKTPPNGGPQFLTSIPQTPAAIDYQYTATKVAGDTTNSCVGYHLGTTLEGNRGELQRRAGKAPLAACAGSASDTLDGSQEGSKVYDVVSPDLNKLDR